MSKPTHVDHGFAQDFVTDTLAKAHWLYRQNIEESLLRMGMSAQETLDFIKTLEREGVVAIDDQGRMRLK